MDPSDYEELRQELGEGPLRGRSFPSALQKRILEAAVHSAPPRRQRRFPLAWAGGAAVMATVFAIILFSGNVGMPTDLLSSKSANDGTTAGQMTATNEAANANYEEPALQTALLLGLRTDHPATESRYAYSDYRTVVIAPEDGKVVQTIQGEGILMPYNQDFWMIEPTTHKNQDKEVQILSAGPAKQQESELGAGDVSTSKALESEPSGADIQPIVISEKLLFAGNRDIAIEQEAIMSDSDAEPMTLYWVKHIDQLTGDRRLLADPLQEPHVSLQEALQTQSETTVSTEPSNWTIVRKPGRWVAQEVAYKSEDRQAYELRDLLQPLPREVVSYDKLTVAWEEIWQREPEATDAFSSPNKDLVAIVSEEGVAFYLNSTSLSPEPSLALELQPNESIVMMQWAAAEGSPERWKKLTQQYLAP